MKILKLLALACVLVGGCAKDDPTSPYFETGGRLVEFNLRVGTARFIVNINRLRKITSELSAAGSFEDPAGGAPIVVNVPVLPEVRKTTLTTPPLRCIVKDRPYKVSIRIVDGAGRLVQQLETEIVSAQNQAAAPDKPLVVGPLYQPNPGYHGQVGGASVADCPA